MNYLEATILGIVQGVTEFLPVSSTGHLILTSHWLKLEATPTHEAFEVFVQLGTVVSVLLLYRKRLFSLLTDLNFLKKVSVGCLPVFIIGFLFGKTIKAHLYGVTPVLWALLVGGVLMILLERFLNKKNHQKTQVTTPTLKQASWVGVIQCLALWPGTSRSMSTILGGRLAGLNAVSAAEFSFLLSVPVLSVAGLHDVLKLLKNSTDVSIPWGPYIWGTLVAMVTGVFVIRALITYLSRHSLEVFGWYRIFIAILLFYLLREG